MGQAGAASARAMLETLTRSLPLADEAGIRAAAYLARDHGRVDLCQALVEAATGRREELRGLAAAALWDATPPRAGDHAERMRTCARDVVEDLLASRTIGNVAWGAMIRAASRGATGNGPLLTETCFRWIQWGWLE
jgi:hypothetical protein